jgi:hypothetical protein
VLAAAEIVSVDVDVPPDVNMTEAGLGESVGGLVLGGLMIVAWRTTVPVNPRMLVRVMVDVLEEPITTLRPFGWAEIVKSGVGTKTWIATRWDWVRTPTDAVPVTVTV